MATITTRAGKGSALTFAEMDANFTNLNNELANVTLGVLPENSISATELDNSGDFTVNTITTTGNVVVGDSLIPSSGNLEINTDYLQVSSADGTNKFKIRTDQSPSADQVLKYNETTGFVQWANDSGSTAAQIQSSLDAQNLGDHADVDTSTAVANSILQYNGTDSWDAVALDISTDTSPQLGGNMDVNGNQIFASSDGDIQMNTTGAGRLILDVASITTPTDTNLDIEPNGTGVTNMQRVRLGDGDGGIQLEGDQFSDMLAASRQTTSHYNYSLEVASDSGATAIAAGQVGGAFGFTHKSDALGDFYVGSINGVVGDEGTPGSAGENNNGIRLYTYSDNSGYALNIVSEFRYASAEFMKGELTFDNTSNKITIEAPTSGNDIELKTNGTGELHINTDVAEHYSANGWIIHNNAQGGYTDLTGTYASTFGGMYGTGVDVQSTNDYAGLNLWSHKSNSTYPNLWAHRSREAGGNKDFLDNGDRIFSFLGSGYDGTDTEPNAYGVYAPVGELILVANEDHSASARGGKWQFRTTSTGATSGSTKMEVGDNINALTAIELDEVSTPDTRTDKGWIYAKDVSGTAEVFVKDAAGNETQISPHNEAGEWQYFSRNTKTGKTVRVNMEKMIRKLEEITGETFIENE
jgi:hypothetical protein